MDKTEFVQTSLSGTASSRWRRSIVDESRSYGLDEHEFVALATEHAKAQHPNLTDAQAFANCIEIPEVWRACELLKIHAVRGQSRAGAGWRRGGAGREQSGRGDCAAETTGRGSLAYGIGCGPVRTRADGSGVSQAGAGRGTDSASSGGWHVSISSLG